LAEANQSVTPLAAAQATPEKPRKAPAPRRRRLGLDEYTAGISAGDRTILARAITLIESSRPADRELAEQILETCKEHRNDSIRVGITGPGGAGKSSLIETLGLYLTRERQQKVAVLAFDPSSQLSGGSILGDRTRMTSLAGEEMAFIRPSPSRGSFGGVGQRTREAVLLCEAAGYRNILVETVGAGQSETAVRETVDFMVLVTLANSGDELQGVKRGVMELTDLVVVNKADGNNIDAAERARSVAQDALHFFPASPSGWTPRAITSSAKTGKGMDELWNAVLEFIDLARNNGWLMRGRRRQRRFWMREMIEQELTRRFESHPLVRQQQTELERLVSEGKTTPFMAARALLRTYFGPPTGTAYSRGPKPSRQTDAASD
jgi:LAO/AO transport system kinase